jgi:hypothetical protein
MSCVNQELTDAVRGAIKDRALWFYLLLEEAKAQGGNSDEIAKKAIFKYGQIKGARIGDCQTPREFFDGIVTKNSSLAFAMEEVSVAEDQGIYRFHACALCEAWRELGCTQEEIGRLCKLAMEGDFGLVSSYPLDLSFNCTIGDGAKYCEMVVTKT